MVTQFIWTTATLVSFMTFCSAQDQRTRSRPAVQDMTQMRRDTLTSSSPRYDANASGHKYGVRQYTGIYVAQQYTGLYGFGSTLAYTLLGSTLVYIDFGSTLTYGARQYTGAHTEFSETMTTIKF